VKSLFLFSIIGLFLSDASMAGNGYKRIQPGMGATDVLIEAGKPDDVITDRDGDYWVYVDSNSHPCKVRMSNHKVTADQIQCDDKKIQRGPASVSETDMRGQPISEDQERENRRARYCGLKPIARDGCHIDQCLHGIWQELCP
jgi:hypothetical protein